MRKESTPAKPEICDRAYELSEGLRSYFYPHLQSVVDREKTQIILKHIQGSKVLDAGSGRGNIALCAWKAGYDVTAVDLSSSSLRESAFLFRHEGATIPLIGSSVTGLPMRDDYFDTVLCTDVLEHVPDVRQAVKELSRVLRTEGRLVVSTPNALTFGLFYDHIVTRMISEQKQIPIAYKRHFKLTDREIEQFGWNNKVVFGHCQNFTLGRLRRLIEKAGLTIRHVENWRFLNPYVRSLCTAMGIGPVPLADRLDLVIAKWIPNHLAADWILVCEKKV